MSDVVAKERPPKRPNEVLNCAVSFKNKLTTGEALTGMPTVTEATSTLTIDNKAVNTATITFEDGTVCTAGQAVQYRVSGGVAGVTYSITVQCGTDATPAQTLEIEIKLPVKDE